MHRRIFNKRPCMRYEIYESYNPMSQYMCHKRKETNNVIDVIAIHLCLHKRRMCFAIRDVERNSHSIFIFLRTGNLEKIIFLMHATAWENHTS